MPITQLTKRNFVQSIKANDIVVINFWPYWDSQCRSFSQNFAAVSEKISGVLFAEVNVGNREESQLSEELYLSSFPMVMVFREEVIVFSQVIDLVSFDLEEVLKKCLALDMKGIHVELAKNL